MASTTAPTPALTPPPGVTSNFQNPESIVPLANVVVGVCVSVVTIFFFLRCYVRIFVRRTWIWEDAFASLAWAGTVCYCSAVAATMAHYGGIHLYDMTKAQSQQAGYWFSVATIFYGAAIPFTKLTILWLYRRVFVTKRWGFLDICVVGLAVIQGCFYLGTTLLKIFQCTPREKIWDKDLKGTCVDTATILNTSGIFNVASDFLILFLPMYTILRLKMETKKKVMVLMVFTFGLCAPAFSVAGLVQRLRSSANKDFTWNQPRIQFWGAAELTTGLLCFCLPELAILFRKKQTQAGYNYYPTDSYGKPIGSNGQQYGTQRSGTSRNSQVMSEKRLARPKTIRLDSGTSYEGDSDRITPYSPDAITPYSPTQLSPSRHSHRMAELHRHYPEHPGHYPGHSQHSSMDQTGYFPRMSAERYPYNPLNTVTVRKEFTVEITKKPPGIEQNETWEPEPQQDEVEQPTIHAIGTDRPLPEQRRSSYPALQPGQPVVKQPRAVSPDVDVDSEERPVMGQRRPSYSAPRSGQQVAKQSRAVSRDVEVAAEERPVIEQRRPSYWSQQPKQAAVKQPEAVSRDVGVAAEERPIMEQRRPSHLAQQMKRPDVRSSDVEVAAEEPAVPEQRRPSYWAQRVPSLGI